MQETEDHDDLETNEADPMKCKHRCTSCYFHGYEEYMHPAKNFGIKQPSQFFSKYISQGCWTRCLHCQKAAGVTVKMLPEESHSVQSPRTCNTDRCKICAEKFPNADIGEDSHCCSACKEVFFSSEWSPKQVKDHRLLRRDLICSACIARGCSQQHHRVQNYNTYNCALCNTLWGHLKFDKQDHCDLERAEREKTLHCLECKKNKKCDACGTLYWETYCSK